MEIKTGCIVTCWNGERGLVLSTVANKANVRLENGKRAYISFSDITSAVQTYKAADARFLQAKDRLAKYKTSAFGDKRDYPKIDIIVNGEYKVTTTWSKTLKEAKDKYLEKNPDVAPESVKCFFQKNSGLNVYAPGKVDEGTWDKAVDAVKDSSGKAKADFGDKEWATVNTVYQNMGGKFKSKSSVTAGHPNDFDTKYRIGDILVPVDIAASPELGMVIVKDIDQEKQVYVLERRPVANMDLDKAEPTQAYGVRYEETITKIDGDKGLKIYSGLAVEAGCPGDLQQVTKVGDNIKLSFKDVEAIYTPEGMFVSASIKTATKEYVIWGVPAGQTEETLLLEKVEGELITSRADAEKYKKVLETKHGCTKTRIQELDLSQEPVWDAKKLINPTSKWRHSTVKKADIQEYTSAPGVNDDGTVLVDRAPTKGLVSAPGTPAADGNVLTLEEGHPKESDKKGRGELAVMSSAYQQEFGELIKTNGYDRLVSLVAQKRLANKIVQAEVDFDLRSVKVNGGYLLTEDGPMHFIIKDGRVMWDNGGKLSDFQLMSIGRGEMWRSFESAEQNPDEPDYLKKYPAPNTVSDNKNKVKDRVASTSNTTKKYKAMFTDPTAANQEIVKYYDKWAEAVNDGLTNGWVVNSISYNMAYEGYDRYAIMPESRMAGKIASVNSDTQAHAQASGIYRLARKLLTLALTRTDLEDIELLLVESAPGRYRPQFVEDLPVIEQVIEKAFGATNAIVFSDKPTTDYAINIEEFKRAASDQGYLVEILNPESMMELASKTAANNKFTVGTPVHKEMGVRMDGVVVAPFSKDQATDGSYGDPKPNSVFVEWTDGTKGWIFPQALQSKSTKVMARLRPENQKMQDFLTANGIDARVKYIAQGSMKGTWRLQNPVMSWTPELQSKLTNLGFVDFNGQPLNEYSGNGGRFSVFVRGHDELLEQPVESFTDLDADLSRLSSKIQANNTELTQGMMVEGEAEALKSNTCELCGKPTKNISGKPQGFNGKQWDYINLTQVGVPICESCEDSIAITANKNDNDIAIRQGILAKKIARLGNYTSDTHGGRSWKLEAGDIYSEIKDAQDKIRNMREQTPVANMTPEQFSDFKKIRDQLRILMDKGYTIKNLHATVARLQKKAARLGNYDFDIHGGRNWKLEAGDDGLKIKRLENHDGY